MDIIQSLLIVSLWLVSIATSLTMDNNKRAIDELKATIAKMEKGAE